MGGNFAEDRGNLALAVEYNEAEGLRYSDGSTVCTRFIPNLVNTGPNDGIPRAVAGRIAASAVLTDGGLPYNNLLAPLVGNDFPGIVFPGFYDRQLHLRQHRHAAAIRRERRSRPVRPRHDRIPAADFGVPVQSRIGGDGMDPSPQFAAAGADAAHADQCASLTTISRERARDLRGVVCAQQRQGAERVLFGGSRPAVLFGPRLTFSVNNPFLSQQARDTLVANLGPDATSTSIAISAISPIARRPRPRSICIAWSAAWRATSRRSARP